MVNIIQKKFERKKGESSSRCQNAKTKTVLELVCKKESKKSVPYSLHTLAISSWLSIHLQQISKNNSLIHFTGLMKNVLPETNIFKENQLKFIMFCYLLSH